MQFTSSNWVHYDHETTANLIEGGTWETFTTPNSSTHYVKWHKLPHEMTWTFDGALVNSIPVSATDIRRCVDYASGILAQHLYYSGDLQLPTQEEKEKRRRDEIRKIIKSRCFPAIIVKSSPRRPLPSSDDIREQRARETLRRVIGEDRWREFLRKSFIQVRGKSGRYYQIFPAHGITKVFEKGQLIERLCVVLRGDFPPTDSMIMRYLMILNNETDFWKRAVKHGQRQGGIVGAIRRFNEYMHPDIFPQKQKEDKLPLPELVRQLRVG